MKIAKISLLAALISVQAFAAPAQQKPEEEKQQTEEVKPGEQPAAAPQAN